MAAGLLQEIRYALRQLGKSPGFALLAIGTLALGIGANTTILSWIAATLLHPIPGVAQTGRMITLQRGERSEHPTPPLSYPDYVDLRRQAKSVSGMLAYHDDFMALTGSGKPERIYGALVSANYFTVLGVQAAIGRTLTGSPDGEPAGQAEAVLGYDLWRNHFGADPSVIGRTVQINRQPYTIVGVAPQGFQGCKSGLRTDVFIPLGTARQMWGVTAMADRSAAWLNVLATLRPGVHRHQADDELNRVMAGIAEQYATTHQGNNWISSDPLWRSPFGANVYLAGTLPILMALAAVLLLLACANVANLLLVRSVGRRRELAIRLSLGASRGRLVRQMMIEVQIVALAGAALALLVTLWSSRLLAAFLPPSELPLTINGRISLSVLIATMAVAIATAAVCGLIPALRAAQLAPVTVLKEESLSTSGGPAKSRLTSTLVVAQVALSLILLTCAGLFVRSLQAASHTDPGFDPEHMLLLSWDLGPLGYSAADGVAFDREMLARVRAVRGVQSATIADFSPLSFSIHSDDVLPENYVPQPHQSLEIDRGIVGPQYLATMRTSLLAGRDFTDADRDRAQPVAIVNQAFVHRYWPGQNAIGRRIRWRGQWRSIVGVVENAKYRRLIYDPAPLILVPLWQSYASNVTLHVRVAGDPLARAAAVEGAIAALNPDLPLYNATSLESNMLMGSVFERVTVDLAGSFGLIALLLATVGLYGVISYTTEQRTHEIGIRMALGAEKPVILRNVLGEGMRLTLIGVALGLVASLLLTRSLRSVLFGVGTADPLTYAVVALVLCAVALAACYIPALRATRVVPMTALHHE